MPLSHFHPTVARWFAEALGTPTPAQRRGWASIRERRHTLIAAPTGSGKTLAAFLTAIDELVQEGVRAPLPDAVRVVYVSPLKALSADIHKNLAEPRRGIRQLDPEMPRITAAVRTGDTPQAERAAMLRTPPHILVTTPESLHLLLTAERSRDMLRSVRTVIVDEIHAVIGTRRGAHLALSLERLGRVAEQPLMRIGLSATQKPIQEVGCYLTGGQDACSIVDEGHRRDLDVAIELPGSPLEAVMSHEVWQEYYDRLTSLIEAHRTTMVFVNTRRMAERVARHLSERLGDDAVTAHHGSLSKEKRLDAETRLKAGALKALVATASLELGIDIGSVDLVCQIGSPRRIATFLQRVGRSGHTVHGMPKGRLFPVSRDDLVECAALLRCVRRGELDAIVNYDAPLDVLTQQIVAEAASEECTEEELYQLVRRAWPYRALPREQFDAVVKMAAEGYATRRGRRAALLHRDEVQGRLRGRRGARLLAITSGGAIPELADYRVVLDPDETFLGTLNEDFAIESSAGDVFQLGNAAWRVLQVGPGIVRVADAKGAPPNLPFWLGEAPARSDELSRAVSDLRAELDDRLKGETGTAAAWLAEAASLPGAAAEQITSYLDEARRALGALPTQDVLVLERFFDESGGMQLVLHAPFGSRVNKAWGLALRKRFCRQFNFELQAAATDDALLLSLGPQHSFPLSDVFRYLHPATARDVLVQAFLDAPVFQTRWRWNATISLAVPRNRNGRKVPPQLQRMVADDLMAAVFPDAAACLENIPGDRQIPEHPLVEQTVRDCLEEAMDFPQLSAVLARIHAGNVRCLACDTPEPSTLAHEILNARPYAFLDDAPLEERRTHAVMSRRASDPAAAGNLGALDRAAIERVRDEQRADPRDADELHDALVTNGFLRPPEVPHDAREWLAVLTRAGRAGTTRLGGVDAWVAAERLPEFHAVYQTFAVIPDIQPPPSRRTKAWTADEALVELVRGRMTLAGPITAAALASQFGLEVPRVQAALEALEGDGAALRGRFEGAPDGEREWCDRGLLARIHRYTINRLRAEIEPVTPADFMRFLFAWQHADPAARLRGVDGLRAIMAALDGFEAAAAAWERALLPARLDRYETGLLDTLCLTGEVSWARLSPAGGSLPAVGSSMPVAFFLREHADAWLALRARAAEGTGTTDTEDIPDAAAALVTGILRSRGACFVKDIAAAAALDTATVGAALGRLTAAGAVASDSFAGLRSLLRSSRESADGSTLARTAGRWFLVENTAAPPATEPEEVQARALLRRYGVVFRRLLSREPHAPAWRLLVRVYRRLEARGEIRGGRFVGGMSGEQFALPGAVEQLREVRRTPPDGRLIPISAADPLNLAGVLNAGERVRAIASNRILYRDGVPLAALEGDYLKPLADIDTSLAASIATTLAGRPLPAVVSGFVGR